MKLNPVLLLYFLFTEFHKFGSRAAVHQRLGQWFESLFLLTTGYCVSLETDTCSSADVQQKEFINHGRLKISITDQQNTYEEHDQGAQHPPGHTVNTLEQRELLHTWTDKHRQDRSVKKDNVNPERGGKPNDTMSQDPGSRMEGGPAPEERGDRERGSGFWKLYYCSCEDHMDGYEGELLFRICPQNQHKVCSDAYQKPVKLKLV